MTAPLEISEKLQMDFKPFNGWHYNAAKVDFQSVLAPPYDVISPAGQEELYERSDFNCIRLILNRIEESDTEENNRYTRAKAFFNAWQTEDVLVQDEVGCFYLYEQTFADPLSGAQRQRTALLGRLKLEPFEKGIVVPHEKTLAGPKKDRKQLLEVAQTNFSPIFGLYEDPEGSVPAQYGKAKEQEPLFVVTDETGVTHKLWIIDQAEMTEAITTQLSTKKVYIADGHHRYQTSLDYSLDQRAKANAAEGQELGSDYTLMALVEFNDPGLVLYPTHRMVKTLEFASKLTSSENSSEEAIERLKEYFEVESLPLSELEAKVDSLPEGKIGFGIAWKDQAFYLTVKDWENVKSLMPEGHDDLWYQLDVNIVSHFVLAAMWGVDESNWEQVLSYTHTAKEAYESIDEGKSICGFVLKAPKVEILRDMGNVNELMAQKSTYFYPKLASGLVFYHHNE